MNGTELCKQICYLDQSILGAGIIEKSELVSMYSKPGIPIPAKKEMDRLSVQTELIAGMAMTNEQLFGQPQYFAISFKHCDFYFFFLQQKSRWQVLVVQVAGARNDQQILPKLQHHLEDIATALKSIS